MSAENARVELVLVGRDEASAAVRTVTAEMQRLERQAKALGAALGGSLGVELGRRFDELSTRAMTFGAGMGEASEKVAKALGADTTAARELRDMLREVASAQDTVARGARAGAGGNRSPRGPSGAGNAGGRPGRNVPAGNDLRDIRARWRIREASERAERRDAEQERRATASAAAAQVRAQHDAFAQRLRDARYLIGVRERSEAAELRHAAGLRREHENMRRRAASAGTHAFRHAQHAVRSVNHPVLQSPGFWLHAGAVFGVEAGKHLLDAARSIDAATTRYKMMPGVSTADAAAVRANALRESMRIGLDPAEVVRLQLQGMKDGLSKDIAASLPAVVNAAVQTMGGSIDRDGDELAKAVREAFTVGWVRDPAGARSLMNSVAGLSTFNGNSPEKMNQFLASGGIGRGKELGWSKDQTLAFGAALNGSGERTGLGSARLMAQIPEIRAEMKDRFIKATRSHNNSEENRAARAAPRMMGYGGISDMQQAFATPEGVTDFLSRLGKLPEQTRAAIEKAYGLGPQFNAVAAEMGADHGARYHEAFKRETELSSQTPGNDDLAKNGKIWSSSINFMVGQLKASVEAIQSELGDVTAALNALRSSVGTFDFAGFMRGVGEGLRAFMDRLRSLASVFGGAGGLDAQTVGRLAAELFGLSVALHIVAPFVTIVTGLASGFLAVKAALSGVAWLARLTGLSSGLQAIAGVDLAAGAAGLMSFAGALGVISAAVQALLSSGILPKVSLLPKDGTAEGLDAWLWGKKADGTSARPAWVDRLTGGNAQAPAVPSGAPNPGAESPADHWARKNRYLHPSSFDGDGASWRDLLQPASYVTDDASADDRDRNSAAMIGTSRAAQRIADSLATLVPKLGMGATASTLSTVAGFGGGGGEGGGNANLRYGRGTSGGWRSTPGTGSYGNPSKSLLDLIAKSEGAGYNVSWGNGRFLPGGKEQNLTGKSLNEILALGDVMRRQPGARNSSALGRYQITGSTLRDLMKRMGLNGSEKFDEAMQDRLASKLISDEGPRALQRWEGLKRGTYMAQAQGLLRSGSIASQPGDVSFNGAGGGNAGGAVDLALKMQGAGERQAQQILGSYMHPGEWCADFVNGALKRAGINGSGSAMARSFSNWGQHVDPGAVQKGDVITERHGNHVGHVGLATGNVQRDRFGNVTAVEMVSGNYGHMVRKNWERRGIIDDIRRANPTPADLAGAAKALPKGSTPAPHHAPAPQHRMDTASAAPVTIHAPIHVHGVTDPHQFGRMFQEHVASAQRSRYTDPMG